MIQNFDLHMHTKYSDGENNISELIEEIKKIGIKYFSITDHDSVESISNIENLDLTGLCYIPGVEISSILDNKYNMHILGYYIDDKNEQLNNILAKLKQARKERFFELANMIKEKYGFNIPYFELENIVNNINIPGKPHLAKLLIKYNYASNVPEVFGKYLENVKSKISHRLPAELVIKTIKESGGVAIWAHPKKVENQYRINFENVFLRLQQLGIDGIEAFNSLHTYNDSIRYLEFCKEKNLIVSGGSDYHGLNVKPTVKLGVVYSSNEEQKIELSNINIITNEININNNNYYNNGDIILHKDNNIVDGLKKCKKLIK